MALSVSDHTDAAAFLAFDIKVAKLTNFQASEAAKICGMTFSQALPIIFSCYFVS